VPSARSVLSNFSDFGLLCVSVSLWCEPSPQRRCIRAWLQPCHTRNFNIRASAPEKASPWPFFSVTSVPSVPSKFLALAFSVSPCLCGMYSAPQNWNRITSVPCRGVGVANMPVVAAAGFVPFPPTAAGLIYPNPPVVKPPKTVWVAKALVLVG